MIKNFFYLSYKPTHSKGLMISFIIYLAINFTGTLLRKVFAVLSLELIGGIIGLITSVYSFLGIAILLYNYLIKNKEQ